MHTDFALLNNDEILEELTDTEDAIQQVLGSKPTLFRPLYGSIPAEKGAYIRSLGYRIINMSIANGDTQATATIQSMF